MATSSVERALQPADLDERAQDAIGDALTDSGTIDFTYDDLANTLTAIVKALSITNAEIAAGAAIALSKLATDPLARANHTGTQTASTVSDFAEALDDRVAALLVGGANITLTYNDVANTLTVATTVTQYTDEQAQDAVGGALTDTVTIDLTYDDAGNTIKADVVGASLTNAHIAAAAAIAMSKLALAITNAEVAAGAAIAYAKLALAGSIVDADITAAGITTRSKLPAALAYEDEANVFTLAQQVPRLQVNETAHHDGEVDNGSSGAADTIDWTAGNVQKSTLTADCTYTFTAPSGPAHLTLKVIQDATGGRTVTWPASVKWPAGTAPTLSTGANDVDLLVFYYDGTNFLGQFAGDFS